MPAYLSGLCRRLGKNKRIQRWLDRQVCRTPAHVELTVPLMTTWRYLTGRPRSLCRLQAVRKCPILSSVRCRTEGKSLGMLSGWCRKLRKNKRMQRWLHRQVCRAPAHVELTVPLLDDWSTSGGSSSHSALSSQDVSAVISIWYRPMWSSRYLWGISYVPCGDTSKLELHCQDPFRPLLFYCQLQHNKPREFSEIHDQPQRVKQV